MKGDGRLVLVVDDDVDLRETLCDALADEGFAAVGASDGIEALRYLRAAAERPCLILLDLMMPNMNGWEFLDERRRDPHLRAICTAVMTAHSTATISPPVADHFVRKPIDLDRLLHLVATCC